MYPPLDECNPVEASRPGINYPAKTTLQVAELTSLVDSTLPFSESLTAAMPPP